MNLADVLQAILTVVSASAGTGAIVYRLSRLESKVESLALERVENHVRVSKVETRLTRLEDHAA